MRETKQAGNRIDWLSVISQTRLAVTDSKDEGVGVQWE